MTHRWSLERIKNTCWIWSECSRQKYEAYLKLGKRALRQCWWDSRQNKKLERRIRSKYCLTFFCNFEQNEKEHWGENIHQRSKSSWYQRMRKRVESSFRAHHKHRIKDWKWELKLNGKKLRTEGRVQSLGEW